MLNRSAKTATYSEAVAKIEINFPDDLLWQVEEAADRSGESREAFLRRSVEDEVRRSQDQFRKELEELWASHPIDLGGKTAAELIREDRDHRDDKRFGPDGHAR